MFEITPTVRIRKSPFFEATVADGVTGFMTYNQMLMPTGYGNPAAEYWLSIADSNILFWSRAIAAERGLCVEIIEPDVSPLAVQGPKVEAVIAAIFGDWIHDLKFFCFRKTEIEGIPIMLARSGWSKQGGFELYLMDASKGSALWDIVREARQAFDIGPGFFQH